MNESVALVFSYGESYITLQHIKKNNSIVKLVNFLWYQVPSDSKTDLVVLHRFTIKNAHILLGINFIKDNYYFINIISILKDINNSLIYVGDADIYSILLNHNVDPLIPVNICPQNGTSDMTLPIIKFLYILKYVFDAEDFKYPHSHHLGRYLLQLCILDGLYDSSDPYSTVDKYNSLAASYRSKYK